MFPAKLYRRLPQKSANPVKQQATFKDTLHSSFAVTDHFFLSSQKNYHYKPGLSVNTNTIIL
jgi:hypothetical protein